MGYKQLLLKIMANGAAAYAVVRLWREKTAQPTVIEGEVLPPVTFTQEHTAFHLNHGMPLRFYGACGRCQEQLAPQH